MFYSDFESALKSGDRLHDNGDLDEAISAYHCAIKLNSNSGKPYHGIGNVLVKKNKLSEAVEHYKKAIKISPSSATSYYRVAEVLRRKESLDESIIYYQKSIELNPKSFKFLYGIGEAFFQKEEWARAASYYQKVIELNPSLYKAYRKLRIAYQKSDNLQRVQPKLKAIAPRKLNGLPTILFILPVAGGSGGAHSVMQECLEMYCYGLKAKISVDRPNYSNFLKNYSDIEEASDIVIPYTTLTDLKQISHQFSIVCATTWTSVSVLEQLVLENENILPAYYVQDYEPLFESKSSSEWEGARLSYTQIPGMVLFAKTAWLANVVSYNHHVTVHKVEPSIDHQVYYPNLSWKHDRIEIAMMIRFSTPRRAPLRTLRVARKLNQKFSDRVKFTIFGADPDRMTSIPNNTTVLGHLTRPEVANVLRNADIFLDLSDYQAFGRTALEAMACGCVPVVPKRGGASEFAIDRVNSRIVETASDESCIQGITELINCSDRDLSTMKLKAIETASRYSKKRASISIFNMLNDCYAKQ
ncbi:glycosyltransferase family protein [Oscillatoriales cyanobacterium LEGE 11467]|uniref:Glycosyltransferase family protein n=1 Tax=Zarconia navalis LEGE 11467 TaxID=1828826 RepID=A0A928VXY6_9CYAN|nr:tetratricopeptide repeat protein [Zarconia navalis]MBE9039720.1 glycosyltransferase family protein [Zarconia navalis LEGE 11467]